MKSCLFLWCVVVVVGNIYNCEHNQPDRSEPLDAAIISSCHVRHHDVFLLKALDAEYTL